MSNWTGKKGQRTVVHMDLDAFFVSVERLRDRRLEGIPLIIGGVGGRGVVAACSYEARRFGVRSAMPMKMARRLCPSATVISGDMELYSRRSKEVTDVISDRAPLFEKASIDEFYLDLSGMDRFLGAWKWALELRHRVMRETGLPISLGFAANKTVAKMATNEIKPNGELQVAHGGECAFLAPLPVGRIPMVGEKTARMLSNLGIRRIALLQQMPREALFRVMGKSGHVLWQRAQGIDESPVVPWTERKSISLERTFSEDSLDLVALRSTLTSMAERLAFRLRKHGRLAATLTLKIRYADFDTHTRQERIPYSATDQVFIQCAHHLFDTLFQRRQRIRLLGLRCSDLITGGTQLRLFEDTQEQIRLYQAIDRLKIRFGEQALMRASALGGLVHPRRPKLSAPPALLLP